MEAAQSLELPEETIARLMASNEQLRRARDMLQVDLDNANADLAVKRRQITELKHVIEGRVKSGSFGDEVAAAFSYWQERCGHPRARLDHKRAKAIETRMRIRKEQGEDPLREVMRAIDGAMFDAYVDDKGKRHDGISLICRDEDSFDKMRDRWTGALTRGKLSVALGAYCLAPGQLGPVFDVMEQGWRFKCPVCRMGWDRDDYLPLLASRDGTLYCEAACSGLMVLQVRQALLDDFPLVP